MRSLWITAVLCSGLTLAAATMHASDGVIEINQACADTPGTGCMAGDAAGFPVTIMQPGSYRLTGDLSVPAATSGMRVEADRVAIDLNGFAISGPFTCGLPCISGSGTGVESAPLLGNRVTLSNGTISGFGLDGVNLRADAHVERVLVFQAGRHGIVVNSGSIALANRIRGVGDNGLRMVNNLGVGAPIYRDNLIIEANLAGAGATAVSGGRATGGNGCSDGSCSVRGARRFYLTKTMHDGSQASQACQAGFHMASLSEIWDTSTLEYDRIRGLVGAGQGPTLFNVGWVHSGVFGTNPAPGFGTCNGYTSPAAADWGTTVRPHLAWSMLPSSVIDPWEARATACNFPNFVWCVED